MANDVTLRDALIQSWRTSNRVTVFLFEKLPDSLWGEKVPGAPRRTVRMIAGHIHNARCMWIKMLGVRYGIRPPAGVDRRRVTRAQLLAALARSSEAMIRVMEAGLERGGKLPGFPPDVVHFIAYHIAHEGHHRGQIVMLARQLDQRLPTEVTVGLWQWSKRAKETV